MSISAIIFSLLIINLIMVLIHESGFIEKMDEMISTRWKFYHLPYPVRCLVCGTFWISLLYIIITPGAFTLLNILLCLLNAHLTEITQGLWRTIKKLIMDVIGWINNYI